MLTRLSAAEAATRIVAAVPRQPPLRVPLDQALGSILAEPVASPIDIPFRTNSAMDGYAARAADVRGATAEARGGSRSSTESRRGGADPGDRPGRSRRIFTGAPLPEGADSVLRQEDTDEGDPVVTLAKDRDAGVNIRLAGEDIRAGRTVLEPGTELGAAQLGVLASVAVAQPVVFRRPRVGILASGDEIVDVDQPDEILSGRKIASSNTHTLRALIRIAGGEPVDLGIARDDPASIARHLDGAGDCDLVVSTAGISVGEHDHLRAVIESRGGRLDFWRLRMRPGAPVGFGTLGSGQPWIGLPGNPVSTMVTFELFVRPAIRAMMGHRLPFRRARTVTVTEPVNLKPPLQHFLRAVLTEGAPPTIRLTGPQGSGILTSMVAANALLIVPEGLHAVPVGGTLQAIGLDDPHHQECPPFD
ncbi:MAG: molybdopterin molybdotransferase MoeA [Gemmatimonadales bacterium]